VGSASAANVVLSRSVVICEPVTCPPSRQRRRK
jgi:hypothetical protein